MSRKRAPQAWATVTGTLLSLMVTVAAVPARASAASPVDDTSPSASGMPGAEFVRQLLGWGQWVGLAAAAGAIIYGAATWAGFGQMSAGRAASGKTYVLAGCIGAAVIGLLPVMVNMMFDAGRS